MADAASTLKPAPKSAQRSAMTDQPAQKRFRDAPWYTQLLTIILAAVIIIGVVGIIVWLLGAIWMAAIGVWS